jgi:hypothetical protein
VQVSDLYAMQWNPVASAADFSPRENPDYLVYALEQRLGVKKQSIAADIQGELHKLLWAYLLIRNFPIFWFSAPAMLKGWIDRVLVSGVCVVAWHVPYINDEARRDFLLGYAQRLQGLASEQPLVFAKLAQFDEALYPLS